MSEQARLFVTAAGLCCSLGYRLDAAVCALRANIDHFRESAFYSGSDPVQVASLPDNLYGTQRLQRWVEYALHDCLSAVAKPGALFDARHSAIVALVADEGRPSSEGEDPAHAVRLAMQSVAVQYGAASDTMHPPLTVIRQGRAGLVAGLRHAEAQLARGMTYVLLIGVDSLLNAADINFYLQEERLFVPGNTDGFIPGEAAAALVVSRSGACSGLRIAGLGSGHEHGTLDGSVPNRSEGLTAAIRQACAEANMAPGALHFRLSDQNGEHFYTRDAANAITRVTHGGRQPRFLTLADKLGDIGAATGPAMLAWMLRDMHHAQRNPGPAGLLHLANDTGLRNALIIQPALG